MCDWVHQHMDFAFLYHCCIACNIHRLDIGYLLKMKKVPSFHFFFFFTTKQMLQMHSSNKQFANLPHTIAWNFYWTLYIRQFYFSCNLDWLFYIYIIYIYTSMLLQYHLYLYFYAYYIKGQLGHIRKPKSDKCPSDSSSTSTILHAL